MGARAQASPWTIAHRAVPGDDGCGALSARECRNTWWIQGPHPRALRALLVAGAVAAVGPAPAALAAPPAASMARAAEHDARGKDLFSRGDFEGCAREFRKASIEVDDPRFLYNAAKCLERAGHLADAAAEYRAYLDRLPAAPDRSDVEIVISVLEEKQRRAAGLARVALATDPPGARVFVGDGAEASLGSTPLTVELPQGTYTLAFVLEGYQRSERPLTIGEDTPPALFVALEPLAVEGTLAVRANAPGARLLVDGSDAGLADGTPVVLPAGAHTVRVESEGQRPREAEVEVAANALTRLDLDLEPLPGPAEALSTWGYVTGGVGVALLAVGAGFAAAAQGRADDAQARSTPTAFRSEWADTASGAERYAQVGNVSLIAGGALTLVGAALLLVDAVDPERDALGPDAAMRLPPRAPGVARVAP